MHDHGGCRSPGSCCCTSLFSRIFPILSIWETDEDTAEAHTAVMPRIPAMRPHIVPASPGVLLLIGALCAMVPFSAARAQAASTSAATVQLKRAVEDKQEMLVATVTVDGKPVSGASVVFSVSRTFGAMALGEDKTLDDGTAAVAFPNGMPRGVGGDPSFRAVVESPSDLAGSQVEMKFPGATPARPWASEAPRALWSSRPPLALVGTILFLLLCVWSTYLFVVGQLVALRHLNEEG